MPIVIHWACTLRCFVKPTFPNTIHSYNNYFSFYYESLKSIFLKPKFQILAVYNSNNSRMQFLNRKNSDLDAFKQLLSFLQPHTFPTKNPFQWSKSTRFQIVPFSIIFSIWAENISWDIFTPYYMGDKTLLRD